MPNHNLTIISAILLILARPGSNNPIEKSPIQSKTSTAWTADWSYDDRFIAVGNDNGELAIYETGSWKKIKSWKFKATTITRLEWNPKHLILAVTAFWHEGTPNVIQLFDMAADRILTRIPDTMKGRAVSWSASGEEVAFVGAKGRISIFAKEGAFKKTLSFTNPGSLFEIDWHPSENKLLAVEEDIFIIDIDSNRLLSVYDDGSKNKGILTCQWHPSGKFFVTGDYGHENEGEPSYLKYWTAEGTLIKQLRESKSEYRNLRWNSNGKYLAAAGDVLLVCNEKGDVISKTKFDGNNLWGIDWNHKGDRILSSDQGGNIRITDLKGKILKSFTQ